MTNPTPSAPERAARAVKDSVFCDLFSRRRFVFQLYQELHPEDTTTREEAVSIVTIDRVLTTGQHNDLGFLVDDQLVVMVEAQSTWSTNIAVRSLMYLAETYKSYIRQHELDVYSPTPIQLPAPELYVLYTGSKHVPKRISLPDASFGGASGFLSLGIDVLTGGSGIVGQYVGFCHVSDEQVRLHGRSLTAAREAVRISMERGYLTEYLAEHQQEVVDIMYTLYDAEEVERIHRRALEKEAVARGEAKGYARGEAEGKARARDEERVDIARSIMAKLDVDAPRALDIIGVPADEAARYLELLTPEA